MKYDISCNVLVCDFSNLRHNNRPHDSIHEMYLLVRANSTLSSLPLTVRQRDLRERGPRRLVHVRGVRDRRRARPLGAAQRDPRLLPGRRRGQAHLHGQGAHRRRALDHPPRCPAAGKMPHAIEFPFCATYFRTVRVVALDYAS